MAYQSLYRRYRPRRFSDVRGQEHVVRALRNAVRDDKVGHAYLFTGPRGTGKTSTARILAKALNCEHLQDGEPDGTCESCRAIDAGTSYDVQELDAASNNGVGDVRDLIARVNLGSPGRTKVYILDEVHMLTAAASAALLKTLEEPPAHVVFVLATTDPQKVLPTIKSRTQQYDFHLLAADELAEHVAWIIHDAGLGLDPEVIDHVVRAGAGSARDTLSALDQVAAAGGVVDDGDALGDLLDAVAAADAPRALVAVADAVAAGRDPRVLGESLLARLRDVFLVRMGAATDHLPSGEVAQVQAWADQLGDRATTRALEAVGDALLEMRQAPDPRIPLEVALVKMTRLDAAPDLDALTERVARLEAALAGGAAPSAPAPSPAARAAASGGAPAPPAPAAASGAAPAAPAPGGAPAPPAPGTRPAPPVPPGNPAPSAPAGAPSGGARRGGAARAREALAASRGERPAAPSSSAASPDPAPSGAAPSAPARGGPPRPPAPRPAADPAADGGAPSPTAPAPGTDAAAASAPAAADPAGAASPGTAPAAPGGGGLDLDQLNGLWHDSVVPGLRGVTKAMYSVGRFADFDGTTATLALPNEVHRQKCEQKRPEVEAALRDRVGAQVQLVLVVDETGGDGPGGPGSGGGRGGRGPDPAPGDDYDLGGADVHDLEDAPDAPAAGIDVLTDAFPGAELLED